MAILDLKPLSKETIQKMGFTNHDLWMVKIEEDVFGPFETESLKHYALENAALFEEAHASRLENHDWQPFYSFALFQRRTPQVLGQPEAKSAYWILHNGQKVGPLSPMDLDKKIELGILVLTDLVSGDDGHSWHKLFQEPFFDRRKRESQELPFSPIDSSFQKARLELVEKQEAEHEITSSQESMASLAYLGQTKEKTVILNLDEITVQVVHETEVSRSLKWAIPTAASFVIVLAIAGHYAFSSKTIVNLDEENKETQTILPKTTQAEAQRPIEMPARGPASVPQFNQSRSALTRPQFHQEMQSSTPQYELPNDDPEPLAEPAMDDQPPREHSLVNAQPQEEPVAAELPAEQPVIQESTDF
jgi:hypothetical protein